AEATPAADPARPAAPSKNQQRQASRIEAEIEAAEAALVALEHELADPSAWNDPRTAAKSTSRHEQAKRELRELYAEWEAVSG
ncbi:MAG: ABC transporter ATP-binding protein, partial [Solirubrobacteraceae bacterium]